MDWLNLWVNTFMKRLKVKYTFEDGIKSVVFSSVIIGFLNFLSSLLETTGGAVTSFAVYVILLPILVLVCLAVFVAVFRWFAGMQNGKGSFKKDCAAIGLYLGSFILVGGVVMFVLGIIMNATFGSAATTDTNFFVMFLLIGLMVAFLAYIAITVFGLWLEELAAVEKLSIFTTARILGMAVAVVALVVMVIAGAFLELALGPYKTMIAQYGENYTLGV